MLKIESNHKIIVDSVINKDSNIQQMIKFDPVQSFSLDLHHNLYTDHHQPCAFLFCNDYEGQRMTGLFHPRSLKKISQFAGKIIFNLQ